MDNATERVCIECGDTFQTFARPGRPVALCSQSCRVVRSNRLSAERRRAHRPSYNKVCPVCSDAFSTKRADVKCCSPECARADHNRRSREWAAEKYRPIRHGSKPCVGCGVSFQPNRSDRQYCSRLCYEKSRAHRKKQSRPQFRSCSKCGRYGLEYKPGRPVCDRCRCEPNRDKAKQAANHRRRRFRKYGMTEAEYDEMLAEQGGRCAICGTDTPTHHGWAIDHCHDSNMVRGILCSPCNSGIGMLQDDPKIIAAAAAYVAAHNQLRLVI